MTYSHEAEFFKKLLDESNKRPDRLLIVGCGVSGQEAEDIRRATGAEVLGIDILTRQAREGCDLARSSALSIPAKAGSFDAVYCYHVIEHLPDYVGALGEMRRVLSDGGILYLGTPNKLRVIGDIAGRGTPAQILRWNFDAYRARLLHRWSNEQGAHAGFTDRELETALGHYFRWSKNVSLLYYSSKFPRFSRVWRLVFKAGFDRALVTSVFYIAGA